MAKHGKSDELERVERMEIDLTKKAGRSAKNGEWKKGPARGKGRKGKKSSGGKHGYA